MASFIDRIAHVAHEALDTWREELGEHRAGTFKKLPAEHKQALAHGVRLALSGASPQDLHEAGVTHPQPADPHAAIVPYVSLPDEQRKKAHLFHAVAQTLGCGVERWDVKTGTDPGAAYVLMEPLDITIAELVAFPAPPPDPPTRVTGGPEVQVYRLACKVTACKEEADSDYHLALEDDAGNTMIAEAACPGCSSGSHWLAQIAQARGQVEQAISGITEQYQDVGRQATIVGVGFFDRIHGQRGVAPNGIELHPILSIEFAA